MQKRNHILILAFVAVFSCLTSQAALGHGELRSVTSKDGISDLLVNVIYKDSTGYVWFGTESGLDRFDGNIIKPYHLESESKTSSRRVNAITSGTSGNIFIGSNVGLFELQRGSRKPLRLYPNKITGRVSSLVSDCNGTLYVGTDAGLYIYNERKKEMDMQLVVPDMLSSSNKIKALHLQKGKGLWILTQREIHFLSFSKDPISSYSLGKDVECSHLASNGPVLYIGTQGNGIIPFNTDDRKFLETIDVGNNVVTSISVTDRNNILVSTDGEGIFLYSPADNVVREHISTLKETGRLSLRSNSVYSTLIDNNGQLWVGYYQSGVDYTPRNNASITLYSYPGLPDLGRMAVRSLAIAGNSRLIGTHEGLFFVDEESGNVRHIRKPEIKSNLIFCVTYWGGYFYVGTYHGGMYVFDPASGTVRKFGPPEMEGESIFDIEVDANGCLWVGTSSGVYCFGKGSDKPIVELTSNNSHLPPGNVYEIFPDSKGRIWFCTESGMAIWNGHVVSASDFPKGFPSKLKIRAIYEDSKGRLYFVPDRGAVYRSNIELSKINTLGEGMSQRFKMSTFVVEGLDGHLWIGTDKGLCHYDYDGDCEVINNLDGIPAPVFTLCKPYRQDNGDIWFGSANGLYKLDFDVFRKNERDQVQEVCISDIKTNGTSIIHLMKAGDNKMIVNLKNEQSDLEVNVANFNFCNPEFFEVEYFLDGIDTEWKIADGANPIHYFNLPEGTHRLHLRLPGVPGSEKLIVVKRSGSGLWLYILAVTLIIAVAVCGVVIYRFRINIAKKNNIAVDSNVDDDDLSSSGKRKASYLNTRLTDEECKRLMKRLEHVMKTDHPYIDPDLKISNLAKKVDSTAHALSFLFNQYLKTSYYDYINGYRVAKFKDIVKELDTSKYTLSALASMCGFSSRASFFRHFKNITGITPAEYLKSRQV